MKKKILGSLAGAIALIIILLGLSIGEAGNSAELKIDILDVGQGDAILIRTPYEQNILIDGGPDNSVLEGLGESLPFYDKEIDLMILTHPHSDHVVGLVEVLKRYDVDKVIYTGVTHTTDDYLAFLKAVKEEGSEIKIIEGPQEITLGNGLELEILYPLRSFKDKKVPNLNNTSIVARLVYKDRSFLFTGDAEEELEKELIESGQDLKADVLKAGHHGSKTSSSEAFLKVVDPELAVVSVGEDNSFGHPSELTLRRMERLGINILRTDLLGTITIESDGLAISY